MKTMVQALTLAGALGAGGLALSAAAAPAQAQAPVCSVWLAEGGRFMNVPFGSFMPDRAFIPGSDSPMHNINLIDLPVNIGIIKCGSEIILADSGWKQTEYHKMTHFEHFTPLPEQIKLLGLDPADVKKIVIGHAHWDHAGQLLDFPNATLYVQREELRGVEWALNYPNPHISAVNNSPGGCTRSPACGFEPLTLEQVYGKVLHQQAIIVDGDLEISRARNCWKCRPPSASWCLAPTRIPRGRGFATGCRRTFSRPTQCSRCSHTRSATRSRAVITTASRRMSP
jgi:glyoxylase-like metal-dependent hydrolase (beta-lactamase superfamily II)